MKKLKILGIHHSLLSLMGPTRLFFEIMDLFADLGHEILIVGRTKKQTTWMNPQAIAAIEADPKWATLWMEARTQKQRIEVFSAAAQAKGMRGGIVTERLIGQQYKLSQLRSFHPLKHIQPRHKMIVEAEIPLTYPYQYMPSALVDLIPKMDYVLSDSEHYLPLSKYVPGNYIFYVHWPPRSTYRGPNVPEAPILMPEAPAKIWCNSNYTASEIKRLWGPKWRSDFPPLDPQVVYPPLWTDMYDGSKGFNERPYDVVMLSRLDEEKFLVLNELKGFKVAIIGSDYGFKLPSWVHLWKDAPMKTVMQILSQSKVYVHSKGWGILKSGAQSSGEHFGITITEAMSSGCVPIVPKVGGCWTDIACEGKYGFGFSTVDELKQQIGRLVSDESYWDKWHDISLESVKRFDTKTVAGTVKRLLET